MHTTRTSDNVAFLHDGDFSGEITIVGKDRDGGDEGSVVVELKDILDFVAVIVRHELTGMVEEAGVADLMKMAVVLGVQFPKGGG